MSDGSYRFLHDRVQEAAYSLIPEAERADSSSSNREAACGAHSSGKARGGDLRNRQSTQPRRCADGFARDEKEQLAELNLIAGKRAKASTAYVSALKYLVAGTALLSDDGWEQRPDLMFALELHRAECEFLTGELAAAETAPDDAFLARGDSCRQSERHLLAQ